MKKIITLFLGVICLLALSACGKKAAPIVLPDPGKIVSIDVTDSKSTKTHSDKTWISEIISGISSSEPTDKESVQDTPRNENYIKIDLQFEVGTSTLFVYEDNGKYYTEQPYQGIYSITQDVYEQIQESE